MIRLDFETRSRANLRKVGVWRYAEDPSTEILCFAYKIDAGPIRVWRMGQAFPKDLATAITLGAKIKAFNANFERAISEMCGPKIGMPVPKVSQWVDTQAVALMCSLPGSLGILADVLKVEQQKDKDGTRLLRKFSMPKKNGTFVEPKEGPEDFSLLMEYCKQDVRTEESVDKALPIHDLGEEQRVWELDSVINKRGIPMDLRLIKGAIAIERRAQAEAKKSLTQMTNGAVTSPNQTAKIIAFAKKHKYELQNVQLATVTAAILDPGVPRIVKDVLRIRKRTSQAAVKKYAAAASAVCADGRIRSIHRYHGAHTGRWTCTLLQTQNLARPKTKLDDTDNELIRRGDYESLELLYGDPMAVLRDAVRHIISSLGIDDQLLVCDLSSIEARVLGWLASDPKYLKAFREGLDLYKVTAAEIFGCEYDDVTDDQRWVGKQAVLALGYSMGVDTFYTQCVKSKPDISRGLLERAVKAYRKTYYRIVKYWSLIEAAAVSAVAKPGTTTRAGAVSFQMVQGYLTMKLPSGRRLWYPEARIIIQKTKWGENKAVVAYKTCIKKRLWVTKTTYGGRLAENAVQAISRDVFVHGMLLMWEKKLHIIFHTHDEAVAHVKKTRNIQEVVDCMTAVPKWSPGLPLGAKGFATKFYRKD